MRKNKSALLPHRFLECTKLMVKIKHQAKAIFYRHDSLLRLYSTLTKRKLTFAANDLDLLIAELIPSPGFYVELGANDGVAQSQTKYLEVYHGWHGVLIEPTPEIFKMLKMNRSKRNYFENSACVSFKFPNSKIPMLYSDLMTIGLEGQNDIANRGLHAHEGIGHLLRGSENYEYSASATTLNQILTTSKAPRVIELLSLDVEGAELEVLRGIDFTRYKFKILLVETRSIREVEHFLDKHGYLLLAQVSKLDYIFSSAPQAQLSDQELKIEKFLDKLLKSS